MSIRSLTNDTQQLTAELTKARGAATGVGPLNGGPTGGGGSAGSLQLDRIARGVESLLSVTPPPERDDERTALRMDGVL